MDLTDIYMQCQEQLSDRKIYQLRVECNSFTELDYKLEPPVKAMTSLEQMILSGRLHYIYIL